MINKTKDIDFLFFVEHIDREMEAINRLATHLKKSGFSSVILSTFYHSHCSLLLNPKVVVLPYAISQKDWPVSLLKALHQDSICYVNLNWEQLLAPVNLIYKKPKDNFTLNKVIQLTWSQEFSNYLKSCGVNSDNIHVCGNISTEIIYENINRSADLKHKLSKAHNLDESKEWLFFPENYSWAFSTDRQILGKIKKGFPEAVAWEYRQYSKKCLESFLAFISEVAANYPYEVIIRPHPSISQENYYLSFSDKKIKPNGIHIIKTYSARDWLLASDIIGSSWSTVVHDAATIGKRTFLYTPYPRPDWLNVYWNDTIPNIKHPNDVVSIENQTFKNFADIQYINSTAKILIKYSQTIFNYSSPNFLSFIASGITVIAKTVRSYLYNRGFIKDDRMKYDRFNPVFFFLKEKFKPDDI